MVYYRYYCRKPVQRSDASGYFCKATQDPHTSQCFHLLGGDIPTGLDLGKSKYGGPFTTDHVENVKAFFGILYIRFTIGPIFTTDIAASAFLPILKHHLDIWALEAWSLVQKVKVLSTLCLLMVPQCILSLLWF